MVQSLLFLFRTKDRAVVQNDINPAREGMMKDNILVTLQRSIKVALIIIAVCGSGVSAQEQATIQATATVISGITISGSSNIIFGSVTPGVNKTVNKATAGFAGEWNISGSAGAEITLTFTLPDSLREGVNNAAMEIRFVSTDASFSNTASATQSSPNGVIDPNGPSAFPLSVGGVMDVWIGATVWPSIIQTGGSYSGDVVLAVAYTGN